jgi:hypothetical protein
MQQTIIYLYKYFLEFYFHYKKQGVTDGVAGHSELEDTPHHLQPPAIDH